MKEKKVKTNNGGNGTKPPKLKDYEKEGIELSKISGLEDDDIVIAKVRGPVTQKGAQMIIESLRGTFPKNRVLILNNGADISLITAKTLNNLGWFKKEKSNIIRV